MSDKPESLSLDGEVWRIEDERSNPDIGVAWVGYRGGVLSPYEAEELRDWLTHFLTWYYKGETK